MAANSVTEGDKTALRARFGMMSPEERDYELAIMILENGISHSACQRQLYGNGKFGHIHKLYGWLLALTVVVVILMGKNGLELVKSIAGFLKSMV